MDFVGNIYSRSRQMDLFDDDERVPILHDVETFFHSISKDEINRHCELWNNITPSSSEEIYKRYLFAFLSVHTSWQSNRKAYLVLKDWYKWISNKEILRQKLIESSVGLFNNRADYIFSFSHDFWENTKNYQKQPNESWKQCRDRIEKNILGLGLAKSSFALEMVYPLFAEIVCLDTHLFRFYKMDQTKDRNKYKILESHWTTWAKMFNIPCYIARAIYWNRNQKQKDCLYWADVFMKTS